jgi:heptosyltransferase-2/heptosyltransferase-3
MKTPARPLVIRCGAFGDMVLLSALIRPLHARFGVPVDIVTTGPWSLPLLEGQPGVGAILFMRSRKAPYWLSPDQRRVVRRLRERPTGPAWYCDGNDAALALLRRAGITDDRVVFATEHALRPGEHATEQWRRLALLSPKGLLDLPPPPDLSTIAPGCAIEVSEAQRDDLAAWLTRRGMGTRPLVLVQIGNKRTMRRGFKRLAVNSKFWPPDRWVEVLRVVRSRHPTHAIVLLGTGPEYAINEELRAQAALEGVYNVADELPIPRLMALLERGAGLITVDSGPAHAAAAVGCPQVVLFGRASTSLYRPWGASGAQVELLTGEVLGQPDMLGIATEAVINAWSRLVLRPQP